MKKMILLAVVVILGVIIIKSVEAKVAYANEACPMCDDTEVLDYGTNNNGEQIYHCTNCNKNFTKE